MANQYRHWSPNRDESVWYLLDHDNVLAGLIKHTKEDTWEVVDKEGEVLEERVFLQIAKNRAEYLLS